MTHTHTETTHTPDAYTLGPWRMGRRASQLAIYGHGGAEIAEVLATTNPDALANARMIAAAPELLAACRLALGVFRSQFPLEHGNAEICAAWGALESVMERAIG